MNKRIKQIAEQARHWAHFDGLVQYPNSSPDILFEQQFAELIINECASKLEADGIVEVAIELKEHFGVEE